MSDTMLSSERAVGGDESSVSAVSWAAVLAGAFVASAFSIALVALGAGIGLVSISPWSNNNASVTTFGILAAVWLIAVQLFSSGIGGYLAGACARGGRVSTQMKFTSATPRMAFSCGVLEQ